MSTTLPSNLRVLASPEKILGRAPSPVAAFLSPSSTTAFANAETVATSPSPLIHDRELQLLRNAIAALPEHCREIFMLRRFHNLSHQEIARRLAVSESTVNVQLVIGMNRCRQYLRASQETRAS